MKEAWTLEVILAINLNAYKWKFCEEYPEPGWD